ncbi:MAG: hypothetical protein IJY61_07150 [Candidatus Gastranaerophilales bacterium]|nr:hypothetical protein [Candidatus Gastranaerophilales bacterium]
MRISKANVIHCITNKNIENKITNKNSNISFSSSILEEIKSESDDIIRLIPLWKLEAEEVKNKASEEAAIAKSTVDRLLKVVENDARNGYSSEHKNGRLVKLYEMHIVQGVSHPRAMYLFGERGTLDAVLDITDISSPVLTQNFNGSQYIYEFKNNEISQITLGVKRTANTEKFSIRYKFQNGELKDCTKSCELKSLSLVEKGKERKSINSSSECKYTFKNSEIELIEFGKNETDGRVNSFDKQIRFNHHTVIYSEGFNEHSEKLWGKQGQTIVFLDKGNRTYQTLEYDEGWNYQYGTILRGKSLSFDNEGRLVRLNTGYSKAIDDNRKIQGHNILRVNGIPDFIVEKFIY